MPLLYRSAMAKPDLKSVDAYIASQPGHIQPVLERVRRIIRKAVPLAEEMISYKIPTYKLHGRAMLYFAGWKQHDSLYPAGQRLVAAFPDEFASYKISKGTIRYPLSEPVPARLIARIAKFRAQELAARDQTTAPKKR